MEVTEVCCPVCGKPLVFDESKDNCFVDDMDEGVKVKQITCQHCGTPVEVYHVPEKQKKNYPFWNEGNE